MVWAVPEATVFLKFGLIKKELNANTRIALFNEMFLFIPIVIALGQNTLYVYQVGTRISYIFCVWFLPRC